MVKESDMTGWAMGSDEDFRPAYDAEVRRGLKASLPVLVSMAPFGLVLGAQATQKGLSVLEVPLMMGTNFAGGSEFAAIAVWTSPPHVLLILAMTFLVNSRHVLMGAAFVPHLRHLPMRRALPALFFMCDESWAMGLADARARRFFSMTYFLTVGVAMWLSWITITALGALAGPVLGDVTAYGFDMAFPAVFLVLMSGMWKGFRPALPWLVSLVAAGVTYLLVPGAWYVAAGAVSGVASAFLLAEEKA